MTGTLGLHIHVVHVEGILVTPSGGLMIPQSRQACFVGQEVSFANLNDVDQVGRKANVRSTRVVAQSAAGNRQGARGGSFSVWRRIGVFNHLVSV
jgi:hypothetical protein